MARVLANMIVVEVSWLMAVPREEEGNRGMKVPTREVSPGLGW